MKKIILIYLVTVAYIINAQQYPLMGAHVTNKCTDTVNVGDTITIKVFMKWYNKYPKQYLRARTYERGISWVNAWSIRGVGSDSNSFYLKYPITVDDHYITLFVTWIDDTTHYNEQQVDVGCRATTSSSTLHIHVNNTVSISDIMLDKTKKVAYYLDLNGRQLAEPKGFVIAVYTDGTRSKVVFE